MSSAQAGYQCVLSVSWYIAVIRNESSLQPAVCTTANKDKGNEIKAKVNLIYFNPYGGTEFKRPSEKDMKTFQEYLTKRGLHCTIRESKGLDISAACGQLREQELVGEK